MDSNVTSIPIYDIIKFTCNNTAYPFFWHVLGFCVMDVKGLFAVICGMTSILCWMIYGIPQMIMNCRKGIPDEAMSPWLLIFWTVGDTSNMIGAILTNQLVLQTAMAGYAIFCDLVLITQYMYAVLKRHFKNRDSFGPQASIYANDLNSNYIDSVSVDTTSDGLRKQKHRKKIERANGQLNNNENNKRNSITTASGSLFCVIMFFFWSSSAVKSAITMKNGNNLQRYSVGRTLLSVTPAPVHPEPFLDNPKEIVGYVLGCLSTIFYCSGRIPQICKNFGRRCTEGLSVGLFLFAMLGNAFYGAQIFLTSIQQKFLLLHLPWVIGSWGVMLLDSFILFQFFIYRNNRPMTYEILSENEDNDHPPNEISVSITDASFSRNDSDNQLLIP